MHENHIKEELLVAYVDNEVSEDERQEIEEACVSCAKCRGALEEIQGTVNLFQETVIPMPSEEEWFVYKTRLMRKVRWHCFLHSISLWRHLAVLKYRMTRKLHWLLSLIMVGLVHHGLFRRVSMMQKFTVIGYINALYDCAKQIKEDKKSVSDCLKKSRKKTAPLYIRLSMLYAILNQIEEADEYIKRAKEITGKNSDWIDIADIVVDVLKKGEMSEEARGRFDRLVQSLMYRASVHHRAIFSKIFHEIKETSSVRENFLQIYKGVLELYRLFAQLWNPARHHVNQP